MVQRTTIDTQGVSPDNALSLDDLGPLVASERKRRGLSIRDAAEDAGVPFNTFARVERGHLPDLAKFKRLVEWAGADVSRFFERRERSETTPEIVAEHLHSDPNLSPEAADHISGLVTDLYKALARPGHVTAAHLRTARTLRPDVASQTGLLIADLDAALRIRRQRGTEKRV